MTGQSSAASFQHWPEWTYLNTATFEQMPRRAAEAVARHFARRDEWACSDFMQWFEDADYIRARIAEFIRCQPADIAFIPNASAGLSLLLGGLDWRTGDQIVTLEDEFPNRYYYPSHLRGCGVEFVETAWERFDDSLTPRTRLVAIGTVNYSTGFRPPLERIPACYGSHRSSAMGMAPVQAQTATETVLYTFTGNADGGTPTQV